MAGIDPKAAPEPIPGMPDDNGGPAIGHPPKGGRSGRGAANGLPAGDKAAAGGGAGSGVNARMGLPPTAVGAAKTVSGDLCSQRLCSAPNMMQAVAESAHRYYHNYQGGIYHLSGSRLACDWKLLLIK